MRIFWIVLLIVCISVIVGFVLFNRYNISDSYRPTNKGIVLSGTKAFIDDVQRRDYIPAVKLTNTFLNTEKISIKENYTVEFKFKLFDSTQFGYFLNYFGKNHKVSFLFDQSLGEDSFKVSINMTHDSVVNSFHLSFSKNINIEQWNFVKISFLLQNNLIIASLNNNVQSFKIKFGFHEDDLDIILGSRQSNFPNSFDVASIAIKDLLFYTESENSEKSKDRILLLNIPFDEGIGNSYIDRVNNQSYYLQNLKWLNDYYYQWKKVASISVQGDSVAVIYDSLSSQILLITSSWIQSFSLIRDKLFERSYYQNRLTIPEPAFVPNLEENVIYAFNAGLGNVATYDVERRYWEGISNENNIRQYYKAARFYSKKLNKLYSYGGYGFFTIKDSLLYYDFNTKSWVNLDYKKQITPIGNYSLINVDDSNLLVIGNSGNYSGKQSDGFFDDLVYLYRFNLNTLTRETIKNLSNNQYNLRNITPVLYESDSNSLIVTSEIGHLDYCNEIQLFRIGINKDTAIIPLGLPLSYDCGKHNQKLFFYDKKTRKIFIVLYNFMGYDQLRSEKISDSENFVRVYSINYPIIESKTIEHYSRNSEEGANRYSLFLISLPGFLLFIYLTVRTIRKMKVKRSKISKNKTDNGKNIIETINSENDGFEKSFNININPENCGTMIYIYLFGKLEICSDNTTLSLDTFSNKMLQVFLLIILNTYTFKKEIISKGININKFSEILWEDYSPEAQKNNRNVTISKIRNSLSVFPEIRIVTKNRFLLLETDENVQIDFVDFLKLRNKMNNERVDIKIIDPLLRIVERGDFLEEFDFEWLESTKVEVKNEIKSFLVSSAEYLIKQKNYILSERITDMILNIESSDINGLELKLQLLVKRNRINTAKNVYDRFRTNYEELYGIVLKNTFTEYLKKYQEKE